MTVIKIHDMSWHIVIKHNLPLRRLHYPPPPQITKNVSKHMVTFSDFLCLNWSNQFTGATCDSFSNFLTLTFACKSSGDWAGLVCCIFFLLEEFINLFYALPFFFCGTDGLTYWLAFLLSCGANKYSLAHFGCLFSFCRGHCHNVNPGPLLNIGKKRRVICSFGVDLLSMKL